MSEEKTVLKQAVNDLSYFQLFLYRNYLFRLVTEITIKFKRQKMVSSWGFDNKSAQQVCDGLFITHNT